MAANALMAGLTFLSAGAVVAGVAYQLVAGGPTAAAPAGPGTPQMHVIFITGAGPAPMPAPFVARVRGLLEAAVGGFASCDVISDNELFAENFGIMVANTAAAGAPQTAFREPAFVQDVCDRAARAAATLPVLVVGHSYGGMAATMVARKLRGAAGVAVATLGSIYVPPASPDSLPLVHFMFHGDLSARVLTAAVPAAKDRDTFDAGFDLQWLAHGLPISSDAEVNARIRHEATNKAAVGTDNERAIHEQYYKQLAPLVRAAAARLLNLRLPG